MLINTPKWPHFPGPGALGGPHCTRVLPRPSGTVQPFSVSYPQRGLNDSDGEHPDLFCACALGLLTAAGAALAAPGCPVRAGVHFLREHLPTEVARRRLARGPPAEPQGGHGREYQGCNCQNGSGARSEAPCADQRRPGVGGLQGCLQEVWTTRGVGEWISKGPRVHGPTREGIPLTTLFVQV